MDNKILMIIFDGIGDRPVKELDDKTPLEAANTPNLDLLAEKGINGIMDTISPGIRPGSDTGHLAMLGYNPFDVYTGRGPFEAAGIGLELKPEYVAFRCNFATVDNGKITNRRAGRIKEGTKELAEAVNDIDLGVDFHFQEAVEHRGVLLFKEKGLGAQVTDVDPHGPGGEYHESKSSIDNEVNRKTAEIINEFTKKSYEVLTDHPVNRKREEEGKPPANIILSRGSGEVPKIKSIEEKYDLKAAGITGIPLVKGVCRLAGMDIIDVKGATGGLDTDIEGMMISAKKALEDYNFVLVNVKGCDLLGHDGKAIEKKEFIEKLDKSISRFHDIEDTYCAFTGDHSTPVDVKGHSGDPLPLTICGTGVRTDQVQKFNERSCAGGGLGRITGNDLFNTLLDLANKAEKFGA